MKIKKEYPYINNIDNDKTLSTNNNEDFLDKETIIYFHKLDNKFNTSYTDVLFFDNFESRDNYFTNEDNYIDKISTNWNFKNNNQLIINYNYLELLETNYLFTEIYIPHKEETKKLCFFITNIISINHKTTLLEIEIDIINSFLSNINHINECEYVEGHAPVNLSSNIDDFLKSPLNNSKYILDKEDFDFNKDNISHSEFIPYNSNELYICFATSNNWNTVSNINEVGDKQDELHLPSGYHYYAIQDSIFDDFINTLQEEYNSFLISGIKYIYILDKSFINLTSSFTVNNFIVHTLDVFQDTFINKKKFVLDKDKFKYVDNYTKLYTSQFNNILLTDLNGKEVNINIEDISSTLSIDVISNPLAPFINLNTFINGVGSDNKTLYSVKKLEHPNSTLELFDSKNIIFEHKIPTFGIFQSNNTKYKNENSIINNNKYNINETEFKNNNLNINTNFNNNIASSNNSERNNKLINSNNLNNVNVDNSHYADSVANSILSKKLVSGLSQELNQASYSTQDNINHINYEGKIYYEVTSAFVNGVVGMASIADPSGGLSETSGIASTVGGALKFGAGMIVSETLYNTARSSSISVTNSQYRTDMAINGSFRDIDVTLYDGTSIHVDKDNGIVNDNLEYQAENMISKNLSTATNTKNTLDNVATNTNNTNNDNYNKTKDTNLLINSNNKNQHDDNINSQINQQNYLPPVKYGFETNFNNGKDITHALLGIDIKIQSISKADEEKISKKFKRYGYKYNGILTNLSFKQNDDFTYIKTNYLYIRNLSLNSNMVEKINEIFKKGVTLWHK